MAHQNGHDDTGLGRLLKGIELSECSEKASVEEPDGHHQDDNYYDQESDDGDDDDDDHDDVSSSSDEENARIDGAQKMSERRGAKRDAPGDAPASAIDLGDGSDSSEFNDPPCKRVTNVEGLREQAFDVGYDSDGGSAPVDKTNEEQAMMNDERPLGESPPSDSGDNEEDEEPPNKPVDIGEKELDKLSVPQLKIELMIRNVQFSSKLKKGELKDRLQQSLALPVVNPRRRKGVNKKSDKNKNKKRVDDMSEFAPGACWKALQPDPEPVAEPINEGFNNAGAPTTAPEDAGKPQGTKHNFSVTFDRPAFKGEKEVPIKTATGSVKRNAKGEVEYEKAPRTRGGPKLSFLREHKLDELSHPAEHVEAFLPLKMNRCRNKSHVPYLSIADMQQWTNLKASLANAGTDECYKDFKPFTIKEMQQHLGLYVLNGISPSPSLDKKFDKTDEANYNHFVDSNMSNGVRRHRMFRAFFSLQNLRKNVPPREQSPLFKLLPLINWINKVGQVSWDLSINLSIDEQTISFQGHHIDKLRITHKAAGDGFQCDALCDRGFTHSIYFRNEKPPRKCIKKGLSPLHARVMWLLDKMQDEFTRAWMDNLFISAKLAKTAYLHEKKVLIAGAGRTNGRGIPNSVTQEEVKNDKNRLRMTRGTVKAAVLCGDKDVPNLVATSVYDTKPAHFLSTICDSIKWIEKQKKVWNEANQEMEFVECLRLNMNDDYNMDMNAVDIADQLRNNCRFDHWLRNFKWWWAIALWGLGALLVNACASYTSVMDVFGIPKRDRLTHCQFRLEIVRVWIAKDGEERMRQWKEEKARKMDPEADNTESELSDDEEDLYPLATNNNKETPLAKRAKTNNNKTPVRVSPTFSTLRPGIEGFGCCVSPEDSVKCPRMSDDTLSPAGKLNGRLDFFSKKHLPLSKKMAGKSKDTKCALHRWAVGRDCTMREGVLVCRDCQVPLCMDCCTMFHTVEDLPKEKEKSKEKMLGIRPVVKIPSNSHPRSDTNKSKKRKRRS